MKHASLCFVDVVHCVSRTVCFVHFAHIFRVKLCIIYIVIASLVLVYNVCAYAHYPAVFQTLQNILAEKKVKELQHTAFNGNVGR